MTGLWGAWVRGVLMAAAIALAGLVGVSSASAAGDVFTRGAPVALVAPADQLSGTNVSVEAVGCSSAGNCSAVGNYTTPGNNGFGVPMGVSYDEIGGVWQAPASFSLPYDEPGFAIWTGVACVSSGNCLAIGWMTSPTNTSVALQATETGGVWGSATVVALPADVYPGGDSAATRGVSCSSAGSCVAVGLYTSTTLLGNSGNETDSMAATGTIDGLGSFTNVQDNSSLTGVACASGASSCTAVGYEQQNGLGPNLAEVISETGGSWGSPTVITPNATGYGAVMTAIACPQVNLCTAAGDFAPPSGGTNPTSFTIEQAADGSWSSPANLGSPMYPTALSCVSTADCTLTGAGASGGGFYADETNGVWGQAALEPLPAGAASSPQSSAYVSCGGAQCAAVGNYYSTTDVGTEEYAVTATANLLPPSGTVVACSLLTDGTTNYSCKATVSDVSGAMPPGTPTGTVMLSSTLGTFPNGSTCTLAAGSTAGSASCSLDYDPGAGYGTQVTITGAYSGDNNFSKSQGQKTFTPECKQDTTTDGAWQIGGCFTNPDTTDDDTQATSTLDGMTVTPSSTSDEVDYSTGGSGGAAVSTSAATSLALDVTSLSGGSQGLLTLTNKLAKLSLSGGPVTVPLASGFNLLGLPLSGSITFTPQSGGTAVGKVAGTLPGILGGGPATVTVTTSFAGQVTSVVATATSGTLANVYGLSTLKLSYGNSTWTVNATAKGAGGTTQTLSGSLSFTSSGKPSGGNLEISNVVLAGLLKVKTFKVSYSAAGWGGSADLAQGAQAASVSFTFTNAGVMTSGSITASGVTLWQVFTLTKFSMTYQQAGNKWGLSMAVEGKKGAPKVTASLAVANGTVTGADLDFKNVSMLGKVTIDDLHLKYAHSGTHDDFSGSTQLSLPSTVVSGVEGAFRMVDGKLVMAKLVLTGNVPLYGALTLTKLGGEIDLIPQKQIKGFIDLSAGPKIANRSLLGMENGEIDYTFPASGSGPGTYEFSGDITALGKTLGHGDLTVDSGIAKLQLTLGSKGAGFKLGSSLTANGSITGGLRGTKFTAHGTVHFDVRLFGHTYPANGDLVVSNNGVKACAMIPAISKKGDSGIFSTWTGEITTYRGTCV